MKSKHPISETPAAHYFEDHGFEAIQARGLERAFNRLDHKIDILDIRATTLENKLDTVDRKVDALDAKIDREILGLNNKIDCEISGLNNKIDKVEHNLIKWMGAFTVALFGTTASIFGVVGFYIGQ